MYEDLLLAQANLVLLTDLHLLYLVIPYDLVDQVRPVMNTYYNIVSILEIYLLNLIVFKNCSSQS